MPEEMESPDHKGSCGDQLLAAERSSELAALWALVERVPSGDVDAARKVRRLTRASARHRRRLRGGAPGPHAPLRAPDAGEAVLLALLNLAVRDKSYGLSIKNAVRNLEHINGATGSMGT